MQPATRELLAQLGEAEWFSAVGHPLEPALADSVAAVGSWNEAVAACSTDEWSNFTLEMQNQQTMFLHTHHRDRYRRWNDLVEEAKTAAKPLMTKIASFFEQLGTPEVKHCVEWDVLAACMELEYADVRPPGFSNGLMGWYLSGRFPCGWGERDKAGVIHLYGPTDQSDYDPNEPDWLKLVLANQDRVFQPKISLPSVGKLLVF
jgi:hypothetical protein